MDATAPVRRKPRGFKIALIVILVLFLLFVAAIYFLPYFLPIDTIRQVAKAKAKEMAGLELDFRGLGFSWNGSVVLDGIVVSPAVAEGQPAAEPLLTVDEVKTNVAITPLLSGKIVVNSVDVNGFSVRVRRAADGSMNLPDFSKLQAIAQVPAPAHEPGTSARRLLLSARAAETAAAKPLPPIELHRLELRKGVLSFEDEAEKLELDMGVDFFRVEGATLNDPFVIAGRVLPYAGDAAKGEVPFTGRVAMIKDGAFDPNGEASLEIDVKAFSLHELAQKLGLGGLLASGTANGLVKLGYSQAKALVSAKDFRLAGVGLGLGDGLSVAVPDSSAALEGEFDPQPGVVTLSNLGLTNQLVQIQGKGWVEDIYALAEGGTPVAAIDYAGTANFADLTRYLKSQNLGLPELPAVSGDGSFSGKAVLGKPEKAGDPLSPTLTLDFSKGNLAAKDAATGIAAEVGLTGVGLKAAATLGGTVDVNAGLTLANVPVSAVVPQIGREPVSLAVNGGVAVTASSAGALAAELRLANTTAKVPATPWSAAMNIRNPETRLTYDLTKDELVVQAASFEIGEGVRGGVKAGTASGILSGKPRAQLDFELSALLEQVKTLFRPLVPELATRLSGALRAAARVKLDNGQAEAVTQAEIDNVSLGVALSPLAAQVDTPKTTLVLSAGVDLAKPTDINLASLTVDAAGATLRVDEKSGLAMAGRLGETAVRAAGKIDAGAMQANFSNLALSLNGLALNIGQGGQQVAGLSSGVMQAVVAAPDKPAVLPLSGQGDFNLPSLDAGADKLVFYRLADGKREDSDFGSLRAKLGVDGYLGGEKRQLVNIRTAALSAKPLAVNSRGQFDLGSYAVVLEYAGRLAPAGMTSILGFFNLPPALLDDAAVSGVLNYDGSQATSKGTAQGKLRLASGEISPFESPHDLSAASTAADTSLAVNVRRLDGNVKTAAGEAVVTLTAQPSNLLLSRAGSKGVLDVRLNGAAGPTRVLAIGVAGVMPQLREYANLLYQARAEGVYNAWLQVQDKDPTTVSLKLGGVWQGAAVHVGNVPYLAEAGKLSAALEGDFSFKDNRATLSRLFFRSDSGLVQADGTANATLSADAAGDINGVASVNVDLKFVMADLAKTVMTFPGLVPADLALAGRLDGSFKAGGNADDIRVGEGAVRFQGFQAKPGGIDVAIPSGAAAFGATIALALNNPVGQPSPYDVLKLFNLRDGQASLTGARLRDRNIKTLAGAFQLQNGLLTLSSGRLEMDDGGGAAADGTVDFNQPAPAANLRLTLRNAHLADVNPELKDYLEFQSGVVNLPAAQGQAASVAFQGFSEDEILRTLRLDNFTFATGPVTIHTGPVLNSELDKAKTLMKQEMSHAGEVRVITLTSVTGLAQASGNGVIVIPVDRPIQVVGDNTGDFRVQGTVSADHTLNLDFFVVGKLENLIGFSLPNIIPNLRSGTDEEKSRFMAKMNQNAAAGHYKVNVSGSLQQPNLSGIGELAGRFIADMVVAAPAQIIGGVLELGKDAPGASLNAPKTIVNAPKNITKGLGNILGVYRDQGGAETHEQQPEATQQAQPQGQAVPQTGYAPGQQAAPAQPAPQTGYTPGQQPAPAQPAPAQPAPQQEQRGFRLPFTR